MAACRPAGMRARRFQYRADLPQRAGQLPVGALADRGRAAGGRVTSPSSIRRVVVLPTLLGILAPLTALDQRS
jgi:hypothetical protein